ncbi:MAG: tetratricopeptide repeat protein [Hyphomicrobiaceae bacterium]
MKTRQQFVLAQFVSILLLGATASAQDGTSSWVKRTKAPHKSEAPPLSPRDAATETPLRLKGTLQPRNLTTRRTPLGKLLVTPSGEDAAYIAFDQGQYLTALRLAKARAKKADPQAHTLIGRLHAEGLGVAKNTLAAAQWYRRGAELGDIEAMFALGLILVGSDEVKRDPQGAGQMFERAARKGHPYAHYNLALLFLSGNGKPENPYRAAQHLEYAARKGIASAQYDLAALYEKGVGVDVDAYKSAFWLRKAAENGLPAGQFEYAMVLLRGYGFNADRPRALDFLRAAANNGLASAQNRLAYVYADGIVGTQPNPKLAAKWRMIARASGLTDSVLDERITSMPDQILAEARKEADAFAAGLRGGTAVSRTQ